MEFDDFDNATENLKSTGMDSPGPTAAQNSRPIEISKPASGSKFLSVDAGGKGTSHSSKHLKSPREDSDHSVSGISKSPEPTPRDGHSRSHKSKKDRSRKRDHSDREDADDHHHHKKHKSHHHDHESS